MKEAPEDADGRTTKELFFEALEREGAARKELVGAVRARDPGRGARLEKLVEDYEEAGTWAPILPPVVKRFIETAESAPAPGMLVGDYELVEKVGVGSSGVIWRARQVSLDRTVALKLLRLGTLAKESEIERFRAEAETVARLDHPNIVPVYEVGELEGRPFFSMRWVEGEDLAARIGDPWEARAAARFLATVAWAVHHAHQRGLLHRDLKPSNILISADGVPHVVDFGIAKRLDAGETAFEGMLVGTPLYMAPEQITLTSELTVGADVWALGCILFEMLTGQSPFQGDSISALLREICAGEPAPLLEQARVRRDLKTIVLTCLRKDPGARYASAEALAKDLERWLAHVPIQARETPRLQRLSLAWRRSPFAASLLALVGFLIVALAVGASWTSLQQRRGLRESLLLAARTTRLSNESGRRAEALELLARAAVLGEGRDVQDEVVASLALTDLRKVAEWSTVEMRSYSFDDRLERYAWIDPAGALHLSRIGATKPEVTLALPEPAVHVWFAPGGDALLVSHGESFGLWDCDDASEPLFEGDGTLPGQRIEFSPDGSVLAWPAPDGRLRIVEVTSGAEPTEWTYPGRLNCFDFSRDGEVLALGLAGDEVFAIELRDVQSGEQISRIELPSSPFDLEEVFEPRSWIVVCADGVGYRWTIGAEEPIALLSGHLAESVRVIGAPSSSLAVTYAWDDLMRLWDVRSGELLVTVEAYPLCFDRTGRLLAFHTSDTFGVLELDHEVVVRTLYGHTGKNPERLGFGPDGGWIWSAGSDGARRWDVRRGTSEAVGDPRAIDVIVFADGERCLVRLPERVELRSLDDPEASETIFDGAVSELEASADGGVVVWKLPGEYHVLHRGEPDRRVIIPIEPSVRRVELSADGRLLAAGTWGGTGAQVWDAASGERVADLCPDAVSASVEFSPDGSLLAIGRSRDYLLVELPTGREVFRVPRRSFARYGGPLAFSPDGRRLAVGTEFGVAAVYDVSTGRELLRLEPPVRSPFKVLEFSPDGSRLAFGAWTNRILLWDLDAIRDELNELGLESR